MSYRRVLLGLFAVFFGYMLWLALHMETPAAASALWPLIVGILVVLMIPEKRLGGEMFVRLIEAFKGEQT